MLQAASPSAGARSSGHWIDADFINSYWRSFRNLSASLKVCGPVFRASPHRILRNKLFAGVFFGASVRCVKIRY